MKGGFDVLQGSFLGDNAPASALRVPLLLLRPRAGSRSAVQLRRSAAVKSFRWASVSLCRITKWWETGYVTDLAAPIKVAAGYVVIGCFLVNSGAATGLTNFNVFDIWRLRGCLATLVPFRPAMTAPIHACTDGSMEMAGRWY